MDKLYLTITLGKNRDFRVLSCTICDWTRDFFTSKNIEKPNHSYKFPFEVNVRVVIAFKEIVKGYSGLEIVCGLMNMPSPIHVNAYNNVVSDITNSCLKIGQNSI